MFACLHASLTKAHVASMFNTQKNDFIWNVWCRNGVIRERKVYHQSTNQYTLKMDVHCEI